MFHFIGQVFNALIARPIFNLLILILAIIPGHDFGVAIIIFTIIVRVAMYPLLKKQLHSAIAMRKLQPEMKRIKKEAAGDRTKESQLMMALYKERGINPFGSFGIILVQLPILIALYSGISKMIKKPEALLSFSYSWTHHLPYMQSVAANIHNFNRTFLGLVDLTKPALGHSYGIYWPAMVIVVLSVVIQYVQSKQLMMTDKNSRGIRQIFKDTASGKEVDQAEVQAATMRFTLFFIPGFLFLISISLAPALSLYWFTGGLVAYIQQSYILKKDVTEMEASVDKLPVTAEIIQNNEVSKPSKNKKKKPTKKHKNAKRRR
jgi:YidC/Oxa1 family membrane protein insertase